MCLNVKQSMCTRIGLRNFNLVIWSLTMVEKYFGLTPFVTWVFSWCRPAGFAAHLITQ